MLGGDTIRTEFTVLQYATHDVILGIDFLIECGAKLDCLDCGAGEISLRNVLPVCLEQVTETGQGVFAVADDTLLLPLSAMFIPVKCSHMGAGSSCVALVEHELNTTMKKNVFVPRALVHQEDGFTDVWTVNAGSEPVLLPQGLTLASYAENLDSSLDAISLAYPATNVELDYTADFIKMVNKSLPSEQRHVLQKLLARHASAFDFAQGKCPPPPPESRTQHRFYTGDAPPIR